MTIKEIQEVLGASILCGEEFSGREVIKSCASDMMSDVLAYANEQSTLLTGLCNAQVIRTAEMMDITCVVFVRGKHPDEKMLDMAKEREITILYTELPMFSACGILYQNGLRGSGGK